MYAIKNNGHLCLSSEKKKLSRNKLDVIFSYFFPPPLTCVIGAMTHVWKCVCVMCAEQWFKDWRIVPITPNSFGQLVQFGTAGAVQYVVYPALYTAQ